MRTIKSPFYLIIVSLVALAVLYFENPFGDKTGDLFNKLFLEDLDASAVARIEIEHLLEGVQLEKEKDQWRVASLKTELKKKLEEDQGPETRDHGPKTKKEEETKWSPADNKKVNLSLTILQEIEVTSIAGKNKEKHGYFEVNAVGMQVRAFDKKGKKLLHLYIGKTGPAFTESYVRKEGEEEVYIANRYLRASFPPTTAGWLSPVTGPMNK